MTWIIIIVAILVVVFVISNQKHNKEIEEYHIKRGGFRKSFPTFTNHLENFYEMVFINDTGRSFSYTKNINDTNGNKGLLIIGVKLDLREEPIIFSKYQNKYKNEFLGIDVTGVNFNSIESIDSCINISIDKIKTQGIIDYQDTKSKITNHSISKEFIEEWNIINRELANYEISSELDLFVNNFFIPDLVNPQKFMENFDILKNSWKGMEEGYGTPSVKDILYIPPLFNELFIAAYPDVYEWFQDNGQTDKINIWNKLKKMPEEESKYYLSTPKKKREIYRSIINQYKKEVKELETKNTNVK